MKLGVVAEDPLQQHRLRSAMEDFGCEVVCFKPELLREQGLDQNVSAWLVDLREDDTLLDAFFEVDQPVLLGFEAAPTKRHKDYPNWEKSLYGKLKQLIGTDLIHEKNAASLNEIEKRPVATSALLLPSNISISTGAKAKYIWTLGSSLGGPEAVKEFLDALPDGLPVAFVYGQHIDAQFVPVLARVLARHSHFKLMVACDGMSLCNGEVLIVPAEKEVKFTGGKVTICDHEWPGPYGPSVDQLILNMQCVYQNSGIILFSGMGKDGAEAVQSLTQNEGTVPLQIWAQNSESCASSAMPDSSRKTGAVNFSGTPRELAEHLVAYIQIQEQKNQHAQDKSMGNTGDTTCCN
jgi:chemosensory pili system protein ChpB (putative protein-glutamate methylesterase)